MFARQERGDKEEGGEEAPEVTIREKGVERGGEVFGSRDRAAEKGVGSSDAFGQCRAKCGDWFTRL